MRTIPQYVSFNFRLCLSLILFVIGGFNAQAHDPGLSTATITVGERQIDVLIGFAQRDVEFLLGAGRDQPDIRTAQGFAAIRSQLESVAAQEIKVLLEDTAALPNQATAKRKDSQNIEIRLRFERANALRLRLISTLVARLPFGHREFVSAHTTSGAGLGEAMLSGKANSFQIELPTVTASTISANADHSFFAFLMLGMEHILTGYDHLLFLFGLLVVCRDLRSILTVITCFTVAHSITLGLSAFDVVRLPARIVEPLIAASIAYVGFENLIRGGGAPRWRWLITFSFGLVHGLGFADALKEFGIGSGQFATIVPLVGFNLGVEVGQVSVAAVVLPILWQLRKNPGFARPLVPVGSVAVTLAGSYWMVERILQR